MPGHELDIRIVPAAGEDAAGLIALLDAELGAVYPRVHGIAAGGFEEGGGVFAVGYLGGVAACCGAYRPAAVEDERVAEIKRMYVRPELRGRGLARAMLGFLEGEARRRGFARAVLETGDAQAAAMALYASAGWGRVPAFGEYVGTKYSRCFGKALHGGPSA